MILFQIAGPLALLEAIHQAGMPDEMNIIHCQDEYYVHWSPLDSHDRKVLESKFLAILPLLSHTSRYIAGENGQFYLGTIYTINIDNGARSPVLIAKTGSVAITGLKPSSSLEEKPMITLETMAISAELKEALHYRHNLELNWITLFKIFEKAKHAKIVTGKEKGLRLLKQTANNQELSGDESRHASSKNKSQELINSMKLTDAKALIDQLLNDWLVKEGVLKSQ